MISLIDPTEYPTLCDTQTAANAIMKAHSQFTEARIMDALIARFLWVDVKPEVGEHIDLSNPLCIIAPPKFNVKPEN